MWRIISQTCPGSQICPKGANIPSGRDGVIWLADHDIAHPTVVPRVIPCDRKCTRPVYNIVFIHVRKYWFKWIIFEWLFEMKWYWWYIMYTYITFLLINKKICILTTSACNTKQKCFHKFMQKETLKYIKIHIS